MPYKDALKNKGCKRQWYLDNRDRVLKEAKISYQNNAVLKRKQSREYRKNNILKIKDRYEKKKLEDMELSRCLLICADCHRLIHAGRNDK